MGHMTGVVSAAPRRPSLGETSGATLWLRGAAFWVLVLAVIVPWIFIALIKTPLVLALWSSPEQAAREGAYWAKVVIGSAIVITPIAASMYGALKTRKRFIGFVVGLILGVVLVVANFSALSLVVTRGVSAAEERNKRLGL